MVVCFQKSTLKVGNLFKRIEVPFMMTMTLKDRRVEILYCVCKNKTATFTDRGVQEILPTWRLMVFCNLPVFVHLVINELNMFSSLHDHNVWTIMALKSKRYLGKQTVVLCLTDANRSLSIYKISSQHLHEKNRISY